MGITLFNDKSTRYVDVVYLRYFRDLDLVVGYAWGDDALAHLYIELNNASHYNTKHLSGFGVTARQGYGYQGCMGWIIG